MKDDNVRNLESVREDYNLHELTVDSVNKNPILQFESWIKEAINSHVAEVTAMTLSTVSIDGKPSSRTVLLKKFNDEGFIFFTNYNSKKGNDILANNHVALLFFWRELQRQVRIEGTAHMINREDSVTYFNSRPIESRISAIVSPQSMKIKSDDLKAKYNQLQSEKSENEIVCPEFWGGFIVRPKLLEFWQGRPGRFHDRIQYELINESWETSCLAP